ncbi:MAG: hypothetical protein JWM75_503 [Sphingomonas bacterium]|jgi:iron complex outermembrane receptor protein|nr:hypothetical protein [Sphingomonas bacterium]
MAVRHRNYALHRVRARVGATSMAALSLALAAPAIAQSADPASDATAEATSSRLQDIIVTAQFRNQTVQDTPLAITAISGEMLEARGQTTINDIAGQSPNVTLEKGVGQRGSGLIAYIRGIGQYNAAPFYEPGVGTYVDDVYIASMNSALFRLLDLDRVEVLRGPQGTLAGKNSIGGAIKLFSRKPTGDGSGYAELTYGRYDRVEGRAAADFKLAENLFVRINAAARSEDGYVKRLDYGCLNPGSGFPTQVGVGQNCVLGTAGGESYVGGRLAMRWLPTDKIEINISGDYTAERSDPAPEQLGFITSQAAADAATNALVPFGLPPTRIAGIGLDSRFETGGTYTTYSDYCNRLAFGGAGAYCFDTTLKTNIWGVQGNINVELGENANLTSVTAYRGFSTYTPSDSDGTPLPFSNLQVGAHGHQFSQELRVNADLTDNINLTVGGYYLKSFVNLDQRVDIQYFGFLFFNDDRAPSTSKAAFTQLIWSPIDRLHLTGGLRYTKERRTYTIFRTVPDGSNTPIPGLFGNGGTFRRGRLDYRLNASFDVTDDIMIYGQYATGFKSGGVNGQPFLPNQVFPFGPETIGTYEAGAKFTLLDRRLRLNLAAFRSDYTNIQLQPLTCPPPSLPTDPCAAVQNVGSAYIKGFEAELNLRPVEGLNIDASLAYLDFDYYRINDVPTITLNMKAPFTSDWKASIGAQYAFDMGSTGTITPRIDVTYQSSLFTDPVNGPNNRIAPRTLANARLGWANAGQDWEVALEVTNLFDKYYYANKIDNTTFTGSVYTFPAPPRRWAVSLKRNF